MNQNADNSRAAESIFDAAVQLAGNERSAYLDKACGSDASLREQVEGLLQAHEAAGDFMKEPAAVPAKKTLVLTLPPEENEEDRIGRYMILQPIGEGGCGTVYMAEQEEPVRRRVALKVIKLGMDTKQVIARFEAERQALAMMDHPNIAKVLDAGSTENGRPFFVMELVRGIKITDYCDQNKLSTEQRLLLFIQVCNAIQHAHQKGIIHRDIKPSNILVTLHDGAPVPKVIDFGIAKATQGRLTDQTLFTAFEQFIGTPAYMSPEQAEMSGLDVDTRCDIYALGVLLYELLTGRTPFDPKELLQSGLDELRRTIREKEPARPSTRLSTMLDADVTNIAQRRQSEPPKLIHLLRGDLDWIVMKSLEKDRTRRYETANGFAADIERYLQNEPVRARPPSTLYRFQKLVRRNKLAFAAGVVVFSTLLLGFGVATVLFVKERQARQRADAAEQVQAALARDAEARRIIEADRAHISTLIGKAALFLTQGKTEEAEREIAPVPLDILTNHVATAAIFNYAGEKHARHGRWPQSITNYEKVVAIAPFDFPAYHSLASLLAQTGGGEVVHQHLARTLQRFSASADFATAELLAQDCLLLPPTEKELEAAVKLANTALAAGSNHQAWAEVELTKGFSEYRQGHFASAVDWLQKAAEVPGGDRFTYAKSRMLIAMAQQQLNRADDARATMSDGLRYVDRKLPKLDDEGLGEKWNDWIIVNVLTREARSLIGEAGAAR